MHMAKLDYCPACGSMYREKQTSYEMVVLACRVCNTTMHVPTEMFKRWLLRSRMVGGEPGSR